MRRTVKALALAAAVLAAGCSRTSFVYDHLDWVVDWRLHDYVEFQGEQRDLFSQDFDTLWDWHRSTQLPRYAAELRAVAGEKLPLTAARVHELDETLADHARRVLAEAVHASVPSYRQLTDAQVADILKGLDAQTEKARAKLGPREERDAHDAEMLTKRIEDWTGRLFEDQAQLIQEWAGTREDTAALWVENRKQWRDRFAKVLAARHSRDFEMRLQQHFLEGRAHWSEALRRGVDANRVAGERLAVDLLASLTPEQQEQLRLHLRKLAGDLEALSREAPRSTATKTAQK